MLFDPDRHEAVAAPAWTDAAARREIDAIVRATDAARREHAWWPHHPRDDQPATDAPNKTMYLGAGGVLWARDLLAAKGLAPQLPRRAELWAQACDDYASLPDTGEVVPSWFLGRSFLLLNAMRHGPAARRDEFADALFAEATGNAANKTWELLWGSPGTMLAALFAHEATGDARWANAYQRQADRLWDEWRWDEALGCEVWTQDLYGKVVVYYGAGHGFAGNAFALLRGEALLGAERRERLRARAAATVKALAVREGAHVNWPVYKGRRLNTMLQWCHGAPGFLLSFAGRLPAGDRELDELLLAAGELIWAAGPLKKGACLCHGTDGNGMALLTLFARTGDERWRARARAFAMQAVAQAHANAAVYGDRRYTLWTGDLGLAVYLAACLDGQAHSPALDFV